MKIGSISIWSPICRAEQADNDPLGQLVDDEEARAVTRGLAVIFTISPTASTADTARRLQSPRANAASSDRNVVARLVTHIPIAGAH